MKKSLSLLLLTMTLAGNTNASDNYQAKKQFDDLSAELVGLNKKLDNGDTLTVKENRRIREIGTEMSALQKKITEQKVAYRNQSKQIVMTNEEQLVALSEELNALNKRVDNGDTLTVKENRRIREIGEKIVEITKKIENEKLAYRTKTDIGDDTLTPKRTPDLNVPFTEQSKKLHGFSAKLRRFIAQSLSGVDNKEFFVSDVMTLKQEIRDYALKENLLQRDDTQKLIAVDSKNRYAIKALRLINEASELAKKILTKE